MRRPLEVCACHIEMLDATALTDVLRRLLLLEAKTHGIPAASVSVSTNIAAPDGGEDGRVQWESGPDSTNWLPRRFTLFQCKATAMRPSDCKNEVLGREMAGEGQQELKPRIQEVAREGGSYVLFCHRSYNQNQKDERILAIREAIAECEGETIAENVDVRVYDADAIANWVNDHPAAVVAVLGSAGAPAQLGLQTWRMWSHYSDYEFYYVQDDTLQRHIEELRSLLFQHRTVARIVGLSGLGKTRLALEALRRPDEFQGNETQCMLSDSVVYVDLAVPFPELPRWLVQWRQDGAEGLLVVDNCDLQLHQVLRREIEHADSRMSLLTLDCSPDFDGADCPCIKMEPASEAVIKGIIDQCYPNLPEGDRDHIARCAEGFPHMAVLLAEARIEDRSGALTLRDPLILRKLLWGRDEPNEEAEGVLRTCALFERLGFQGRRTDQREYAATDLCGVDTETFYRHAKWFIERGILVPRGDYVRVVPLPLALHLAESWWRSCSPERRPAILTSPMPDGMGEAMGDRFRMLDYLADAKSVVESLCGADGPFSDAEVLDSEWGSRLFCSLVEVNPEATASALSRAFAGWSREQMVQIKRGRRDLVRALEKLAFWSATFPTAARLLLRFAAAENETWVNNATGQFLQLFHLLLAGTQATPQERLTILDDAVRSYCPEERLLGVQALGHALRTHDYSRIGGVERQGSRPSETDWMPGTRGEVRAYFGGALSRLTEIACRDDDLAETARHEIAGHVRGLIWCGMLDELEHSIAAVANARGNLWPEALQSVYDALEYDGAKHGGEIQERLQRLGEMLEPESLLDQLRLVVSSGPGHAIKSEDGHYVYTGEIRARELALKLGDNADEWFEHLPTLLEGEQRHGYAFGRGLGEAMIGDPEPFMQRVAQVLARVGQNANPSVLCGFVHTVHPVHPGLVSSLLDRMAESKHLARHVVPITCSIEISADDLARLVRMVASEMIPVTSLRSLSYGNVLGHLPPEEVTHFCDGVLEHGSDGAWAALDILSMYCHADEGKWSACSAGFRKILLSAPLSTAEVRGGLDDYYWAEAAKKLLELDPEDCELARCLVEAILSASRTSCLHPHRSDYVREVLEVALAKHMEAVWPTIGDRLLREDMVGRMDLTPLFQGRGLDGGMYSAVADLPVDSLVRWCEDHGTEAQAVLASLAPIFTTGSAGSLVWHPITQCLLDRYGDNEDVLSALWFRIYAYCGTPGETIARWEGQIRALCLLRSHGNPRVREWASDCVQWLQTEIGTMRGLQEEDGD